MAVGRSNGSPLSHRQVALLASWPNCHGWMVWSGLRIRVDMHPTGFSIATLGIGQDKSVRTKSSATSVLAWRPSTRLFQCNPLLHKYVQGGCATIRSQPCPSNGTTSPWMWYAGSASQGSKSQDQASWPAARKASRTRPEYSQATRILTGQKSWGKIGWGKSKAHKLRG